MRDTHDLVDWILALQGDGIGARDRAIARWQETRTEPWLIAALWQLQSAHPSADALLLAGAAVPATSPAHPTVAFLRARLLIALGRLDEARTVLAALPDAPAAEVSEALGYSEQSVFTQAFRRWYGGTPHRFMFRARTYRDWATPG